MDYNLRTVVRESNSRSIGTPVRRFPAVAAGTTPAATASSAWPRAYSASADSPKRACATSPGRRPVGGEPYHYFGGKDEILYYCQDRALDQMLGAARRDAPEPSPLCRSAPRRPDGTRAYAARPGRGRVPRICKQSRCRPRSGAASSPNAIATSSAIRRLVSAGIEAGEFPDRCGRDHPRHARRGELDGHLVPPEGPSSSEAIADTIARFLVRGIDIDIDRRERRTRTRHHGR